MIIVIADDLSGAAELANAAVERGFSAEVQLRFHPASAADVICVDTETRSLPPEAAAARVAEVAQTVTASRPALVYKKCDSVLRGPVADESRAIARALGKERVLLIPANPSRRRVIRGGEYFVDGVPLALTSFAADPEHPRLSSRIAELLGNHQGIETPDVTSPEDLARQAMMMNDETLPAGGVDFFNAFLSSHRPRSEPGRVIEPQPGASLFVCGSHAAWQSGRSAQCARHGIPTMPMPWEFFSANLAAELIERWAGSAVSTLRKRGALLLAIGGETPSAGTTPGLLLSRLAQSVGQILKQTTVARVYLEGGATAAAVLQQLGMDRFTAVTSPGPGVGALQPWGNSQPLFLIKPGSYPWPDQVWKRFDPATRNAEIK